MPERKRKSASDKKAVFIFLDDGKKINAKDCFAKELREEKISLQIFPIRKDENILDTGKHPEERLNALEAVFEEIIKTIPENTLPYLLGYETGAFIGATLFFRRPDLFRGGIFLSGLYDSSAYLNGYQSEKSYLNSPVKFLSNLEGASYFRAFLRSRLIFISGQGPGEEQEIQSLKQLDKILESRSIPAFIDYWGYDVTKTPHWEIKQFQYAAKLILR